MVLVLEMFSLRPFFVTIHLLTIHKSVTELEG